MRNLECRSQNDETAAQYVRRHFALFTLHSSFEWFHCGENEIQASLISSASVGATPTPATNLREVFRLPVCKTGVANNCRK